MKGCLSHYMSSQEAGQLTEVLRTRWGSCGGPRLAVQRSGRLWRVRSSRGCRWLVTSASPRPMSGPRS